MNQEQIKSLIDALAASALNELEYTEGGCTLRLSKTASLFGDHGQPAAAPGATTAPSGMPPPNPAAATAEPRGAECLAPLHGVVHLQPAPGEPAFVSAGQAVAAGQVLCVIEAMKVFNEVRAEADRQLLAVLVASGDEVEAGQPLFAFA